MTKVYLYALIPTREANQTNLPAMKGFDDESDIYAIKLDDITAVVCNLNGEEFTEENIQDKISNDLSWLQKKAVHHHEMLTYLNQKYTVIPLKFCTIYNNKESLSDSVDSQREAMRKSFDLVSGNEEWNLKIYCDENKLKETIRRQSPAIEKKRNEIKTLSKGRQFFENKRLDQLLEKELEKEQDKCCGNIHEKLSKFALYTDMKKNLGKDVTGLKENMSWNSVYLLSKPNVSPFLKEVNDFEQEINETGLRIEATGPWPAYHFSVFS